MAHPWKRIGRGVVYVAESPPFHILAYKLVLGRVQARPGCGKVF